MVSPPGRARAVARGEQALDLLRGQERVDRGSSPPPHGRNGARNVRGDLAPEEQEAQERSQGASDRPCRGR